MSPTSPRPRPPVQFSLLTLLIAFGATAFVLGLYRLLGPQPFVYYFLLVFTVGPWFAHLLSECLPIRSRQVRRAIANFTLLFLFIGGLKLAPQIFDGPPVLITGLAALLLWMPQYMLFFVWRLEQR